MDLIFYIINFNQKNPDVCLFFEKSPTLEPCTTGGRRGIFQRFYPRSTLLPAPKFWSTFGLTPNTGGPGACALRRPVRSAPELVCSLTRGRPLPLARPFGGYGREPPACCCLPWLIRHIYCSCRLQVGCMQFTGNITGSSYEGTQPVNAAFHATGTIALPTVWQESRGQYCNIVQYCNTHVLHVYVYAHVYVLEYSSTRVRTRVCTRVLE